MCDNNSAQRIIPVLFWRKTHKNPTVVLSFLHKRGMHQRMPGMPQFRLFPPGNGACARERRGCRRCARVRQNRGIRQRVRAMPQHPEVSSRKRAVSQRTRRMPQLQIDSVGQSIRQQKKFPPSFLHRTFTYQVQRIGSLGICIKKILKRKKV